MARVRRQRIPAFGEWNYGYVDGAGDWPVTQCFDSAMQMQMQMQMQPGGRLLVAIPPSSSPKPANKVVKWREGSDTLTLELEEHDKEKQRQHVVVGLGASEHDAAPAKQKQGKQQQRPVVMAHASYKACRVAKAMDQDLYHIPPDMLCREPRKRLTGRRSPWMGCLGLNCVA